MLLHKTASTSHEIQLWINANMGLKRIKLWHVGVTLKRSTIAWRNEVKAKEQV